MEDSRGGSGRLCIGATESPVDLMLELASTWRGQFAVLYILLMPRLGKREPGRYESPYPLDFAAVEKFFTKHRVFFESDARHDLWIGSPLDNEGMLILDRHGWIWAYGPVDRYLEVLRRRGFKEGELSLGAHSHCYHQEHDKDEELVMSHWDWHWTPLREGDDD